MIWNYEIGFYKYSNKNQSIIDCISHYPINQSIEDYISNQEYVIIETENEKPKLLDGKVIVLI